MAIYTNAQSVAALYVAVFGRAPDKSGLAFWTDKLDTGATFEQVINGFLGSAESVALIGQNASDSVFLGNLYQNVLSRSADTSGVQFWQGRLDELNDRAALVKEFIFSVKDGTGADTSLLQNKADFGVSFAASKSGDSAHLAKTLLAYITSDVASVDFAKAVNHYIDNPPAPTVPTAPALDFYGKSLNFEFYDSIGLSFTSGLPVGDGAELQPLGYSFDVGHNTVKVSTNFWQPDSYIGPSKIVITDASNALDAFTGFTIVSNSLVMLSGGAPFSASNITVTQDSIEIILAGVNINAGASLEFTVLT